MRLEQKRRKEIHDNLGISESMEDVSHFDQLMDYIIAEKNNYDEEMRTQYNEQTASDSALNRVESEIHDNALGRRKSTEEAKVVAEHTSS